jgi:hypothetical protein
VVVPTTTELRPNAAIITCSGADCIVLPWHVTFRTCPYRSGPEELAICQLATPAGTYTYEELARAFGTEFVPGGRTAKDVGKLFNLGKARTLAIEAEGLEKLLSHILEDLSELPQEDRQAILELLEAHGITGIARKPAHEARVECSGAPPSGSAPVNGGRI